MVPRTSTCLDRSDLSSVQKWSQVLKKQPKRHDRTTAGVKAMPDAIEVPDIYVCLPLCLSAAGPIDKAAFICITIRTCAVTMEWNLKPGPWCLDLCGSCIMYHSLLQC